jgi:BASS family bile acid:Na+ symporter
MLVTVVLPLALAFIMLSLGFGLTLDDFRRVLVYPKAFAIGFLAQVAMVPIIAYLLLQVIQLPPELAVGVMILALCPGGVTSNLISKLARGDVALSVSLTGVVSLLSMVTVPFLVAFSVTSFMGAEAPPVNVTSLAISMALITTIPVLLGVIMRHFSPGLIMRIEPIVAKIAVVLFIIIVLAALATNWSLFIENLVTLSPILILLNILLIVLGMLIARLAGLNAQAVRTVAIEAGVQNSTVGIALGTIIAGAGVTGFTAFTLPAAVYGITMYAVTLPFVLWFRR